METLSQENNRYNNDTNTITKKSDGWNKPDQEQVKTKNIFV